MAPSPAEPNPKKPYYACGKCGFERNWATNLCCHKCGAPAPTRSRDRARELARRSPSKAGTSTERKPRGPRTRAATPAPDADGAKLQQQLDAERRKHAAELKRVAAENKRLKEELERSADADMVDEGDEGGEPLADAVAAARDKLKEAKAMPVSLRGHLAGSYDDFIAKLQDELTVAQAALRANNPAAKRLEGAEAYKTRMEKRLEDAKAAQAKSDAAVLEAQQEANKRKAAAAEAEAAVAKALAEVAELAVKLAAEKATGQPAAANAPPQGADAVAAPLPGYVTVAFAEEKWKEREIAIAARFQELEALVAASASAADGAASVASDVGNVEELDDEAWTKIVGKGKAHRAVLLRKSRDELAAKVRGKLGSVTTVKSPFFKK